MKGWNRMTARAIRVEHARKPVDESACGIPGGIKVGDSYYWWKFRYGGKRYSKTPPKLSQLTNSPFLSQLYAIQESIEQLEANDSLESAVSSIADDLRNLASECQDSLNNMP